MSIKSSLNIGNYDQVKRFAEKFNGAVKNDGNSYVVEIDPEKSYIPLSFTGNRLPCDLKIVGGETSKIINLMYFTDSTITKVRPYKGFADLYRIKFSYCEIRNLSLFDGRTLRKPDYESCKIYLYKNDLEKIPLERIVLLANKNRLKIEIDINEYPELNLFDTVGEFDETHFFIDYADWHKINQK